MTFGMQVIPAIDLMSGKIVRLTRGDPKTSKSYEYFGDPVAVAIRWEREGADAVHIIDLDAALDRGNNTEVIREVVRAVRVPVQVGGGIRTLDIARKLLVIGTHSVILGALAFNDASAVASLLKDFGNDRVVVALDYLNGQVMVKGWKTPVKMTVEEALKKFLDLGTKFFLVTSIEKDGTLAGPDQDVLAKICQGSRAYVIAAGGIGKLEDLVMLRQIGVSGVVIGKALYEGRFNFNRTKIYNTCHYIDRLPQLDGSEWTLKSYDRREHPEFKTTEETHGLNQPRRR